MAYQTYITEALVCGSRNNNTSDRLYLLFSRDAGMVWARARSVREERSKQRFALQDFSHVRATLVRGKGGWRIAGVEPISNMYYENATREARGLVRNIVHLLRRIVHGEVSHTGLFDDVIVSLTRCSECDAKVLELILSFRILRELGYVAPRGEYDSILELTYASDGVEIISDAQKRLCSSALENALHSSQL